jgi:N-acetylmuramoyl-L-alanine amidase CwlA
MVALNYEKKHIKKHPTTRCGLKLIKVQAVVDHSTANPGADAEDHFRYFNETLPAQNDRLPEKYKRYASANIFVDRNKALELVPLGEVCFQANDGGTKSLKLDTLRATHPRYKEGNANLLTLSVEMCLEPDGSIHPDTLERTALVHKYLQKLYPQLKDTQNRFIRHFDVTGKNCPAPMVKNVGLWNELLRLTDAEEVKEVESIYWDGVEMQKGQMGRISILKPINLWKRDEDNNLHFERILWQGEKYRVYGYDDLYDGQYAVGGGYWITKMDGYVKYETPSKAKLEALQELYK